MTKKEFNAKVQELVELQYMIAEAEDEAEVIRDEIKAFMGDIEELRAGLYRVTWRPTTSSRVDTKALREALPDVARDFTRNTTTRRFHVSVA